MQHAATWQTSTAVVPRTQSLSTQHRCHLSCAPHKQLVLCTFPATATSLSSHCCACNYQIGSKRRQEQNKTRARPPSSPRLGSERMCYVGSHRVCNQLPKNYDAEAKTRHNAAGSVQRSSLLWGRPGEPAHTLPCDGPTWPCHAASRQTSRRCSTAEDSTADGTAEAVREAMWFDAQAHKHKVRGQEWGPACMLGCWEPPG